MQQAVWGRDGARSRRCLGVASCLPPIVCTLPAMAFSSSWLTATLAVFSFLSLLLPANALYFYVDGRQTKCFFEDLPKDTLVAGMRVAFGGLNCCG